jgi:hypothetical protein
MSERPNFTENGKNFFSRQRGNMPTTKKGEKRYAEVGKRGRQRKYTKRTFTTRQKAAREFFTTTIVPRAKQIMEERGFVPGAQFPPGEKKQAYNDAISVAWKENYAQWLKDNPKVDNSTKAKIR